MNRNNNIGVNNNVNPSHGMNVGENMGQRGNYFFKKNGPIEGENANVMWCRNESSMNNVMYHGHNMNAVPAPPYSNPVNNMGMDYRSNTQQNNSSGLFGEVKKNVSIFGNRVVQGPLFAKVDPAIKRNREEVFVLSNYINADKSIFGNRLKENKPLFNKKIALNNSYIESYNSPSIGSMRDIIRKNSYGERNKENIIFMPGQMGANQSTQGNNFFRPLHENKECSTFGNKGISNMNANEMCNNMVGGNNNTFFFNKGISGHNTFYPGPPFTPGESSMNNVFYMNNNANTFQTGVHNNEMNNNVVYPHASANFGNVSGAPSGTMLTPPVNMNISQAGLINPEMNSNFMPNAFDCGANRMNQQNMMAAQVYEMNRQNMMNVQLNNTNRQENLINAQLNTMNVQTNFMNASLNNTTVNQTANFMEASCNIPNNAFLTTGINDATSVKNTNVVTTMPFTNSQSVASVNGVGEEINKSINQCNELKLNEKQIEQASVGSTCVPPTISTSVSYTNNDNNNNNNKNNNNNDNNDNINNNDNNNNNKEEVSVSKKEENNTNTNEVLKGQAGEETKLHASEVDHVKESVTGAETNTTNNVVTDKIATNIKAVNIPSMYKNKIEAEKEYIKNDKKKVSFFNSEFLKTLAEKNVSAFNNYEANRSTIKTFPCFQSCDNGEFYRKVIEECKKEERFEIDDELYKKTLSINQKKERTILKKVNGDISTDLFDLPIYYPLLHLEKIEFREPLSSVDKSKNNVMPTFELGKIPTVI